MSRRLVKLVRDDIAKFLGSTEVEYKAIEDPALYSMELRKKLIEEAAECAMEPSLGEIADVYEALVALAHDLGHTETAIRAEADCKAMERGGFFNGVGMYVQTTAPARHEDETDPANPPVDVAW